MCICNVAIAEPLEVHPMSH